MPIAPLPAMAGPRRRKSNLDRRLLSTFRCLLAMCAMRGRAARQRPFRFRRTAAAAAAAPAASNASVPGSGTATAEPPDGEFPTVLRQWGSAAERRHVFISTFRPAERRRNRRRAKGNRRRELAGDEAASKAPIPAPLPNNRPAAAIVTDPLPADALGAAMSSVPPLTVVPPVYVFVPLRVTAASGKRRRRCR